MLTISINAIVGMLIKEAVLSVSLPIVTGIMLIALSVVITVIAGLLSPRKAVRKDPMTAFRTGNAQILPAGTRARKAIRAYSQRITPYEITPTQLSLNSLLMLAPLVRSSRIEETVGDAQFHFSLNAHAIFVAIDVTASQIDCALPRP